ncbi:MAG TPA: DUF1284 domain-containing protein [Candidatus Methanoperedenaceae archaeon]|nr:DUF1284 domain-containing protein [Candidatus Methanoperedenaceae archaeon]
MTSKLRGHHLICLNFFRGEGYSKEFIANIRTVLKDGNVEVVQGPDDVCAVCPYLKEGKCASDEYTNDVILFQDSVALGLLGMRPGDRAGWKTISGKVPSILARWKAQFCAGCGYKKICFG